MTPLEPEEMSPDEMIEEIDALQEEIQSFESKPTFSNYIDWKSRQDSCAKLLRNRAVEIGAFQSRYFQFQKIEQEKIDWKAICRYLVDMKMVKAKDMDSAIDAFTKKDSYGKMLKIKQKDLSLKLS